MDVPAKPPRAVFDSALVRLFLAQRKGVDHESDREVNEIKYDCIPRTRTRRLQR